MFGLWQGDTIFWDPIAIDHWNARDFGGGDSYHTECRAYCDNAQDVARAEAIAAAGAPVKRSYIPGESNLWVKTALEKAGIFKWKGYDIVSPAP